MHSEEIRGTEELNSQVIFNVGQMLGFLAVDAPDKIYQERVFCVS